MCLIKNIPEPVQKIPQQPQLKRACDAQSQLQPGPQEPPQLQNDAPTGEPQDHATDGFGTAAPRGRATTWSGQRPQIKRPAIEMSSRDDIVCLTRANSYAPTTTNNNYYNSTMPMSIYEDFDLLPAPRNPWGDQTYGELITAAIRSVPERRMSLAQIYDWMIQNVPYFSERADKASASGWKNSIRHNLSLHKKFLRLNNEVPGLPSWWVINPNRYGNNATYRGRSATISVPVPEHKRQKKASSAISTVTVKREVPDDEQLQRLQEETDRTVQAIKTALNLSSSAPTENYGSLEMQQTFQQKQSLQAQAQPIIDNCRPVTWQSHAVSQPIAINSQSRGVEFGLEMAQAPTAEAFDCLLSDDEIKASLQSMFPELRSDSCSSLTSSGISVTSSMSAIDEIWSSLSSYSSSDGFGNETASETGSRISDGGASCNSQASARRSGCSMESTTAVWDAYERTNQTTPPMLLERPEQNVDPALKHAAEATHAQGQNKPPSVIDWSDFNQPMEVDEYVASKNSPIGQMPDGGKPNATYDKYVELRAALNRPVVCCDMCKARIIAR